MPVTTELQTLKMSFDEYMISLDEDTRAEWFNGEVILMNPVSQKHYKVTRFLSRVIEEFVELNRLGEVYADTFAMRLSSVSSARVPDVIFVRTANGDRVKATYLDGPADLVVEVVSFDSRACDRGTKFYEYEQAGVPEYWLIDPLREVAEFYRRDALGKFESHPIDEDGFYRSVELTGFRFRPEWLWQTPLPRVHEVVGETVDIPQD